MRAEIIAVGTELLLGQIVNSNAQYISQRLAEIGVNVHFHTVVGDNPERLRQVLAIAKSRSDMVITTGGLGPTKDDLTKHVMAEFFGTELIIDQDAMSAIETFFSQRRIYMTENNRRQALVLKGSQVFPNHFGLAPGMAGSHDGFHYMMFPGPPQEMKPMFERYGIPYLLSLLPEKVVLHSRVLRFYGIGESILEEKLMDLIDAQTNPTIAPLATEAECTIRLTARAKTKEEAKLLIEKVEKEIRARVGRYIYGYDEDSIEQVVVNLLKQRQETASFAESCTGGLISNLITSIPGSSAAFKGSIICYSNEAKMNLLDVPEQIIKEFGAVSDKTAEILAAEVRKKLGTTYGISVTGIAGPDAVEGKPVGLVYIGLAGPDFTQTFEYRYTGTRKGIILRTAKTALFKLWERAKKGEDR